MIISRGAEATKPFEQPGEIRNGVFVHRFKKLDSSCTLAEKVPEDYADTNVTPIDNFSSWVELRPNTLSMKDKCKPNWGGNRCEFTDASFEYSYGGVDILLAIA